MRQYLINQLAYDIFENGHDKVNEDTDGDIATLYINGGSEVFEMACRLEKLQKYNADEFADFLDGDADTITGNRHTARNRANTTSTRQHSLAQRWLHLQRSGKLLNEISHSSHVSGGCPGITTTGDCGAGCKLFEKRKRANENAAH